MKIVVYVQHTFSAWSASDLLVRGFRERFPEIDFVAPPDIDQLNRQIRDADAVISGSLRPEHIRAAPKLSWIHSPSAAVHQLMFPEIIDSEIVLTNSSAVHGPVVAEHAIAMVLAMAKRFPEIVRAQVRHEWIQRQVWEQKHPTRDVAGTTLGLVGLGSIGREIAPKASALGMRIIAIRQHPEKGIELSPNLSIEHKVYGLPDLDKMLAEADFVVLAAPVTDKTKHLFDWDRLKKMKSAAYLINVSRGDLIDEVALVKALHAGAIAGAALDVFEQEPLPGNSPLWDAPNLFITPHSAGLSPKIWDRQLIYIGANIQRFINHEPLQGVVNKNEGY